MNFEFNQEKIMKEMLDFIKENFDIHEEFRKYLLEKYSISEVFNFTEAEKKEILNDFEEYILNKIMDNF